MSRDQLRQALAAERRRNEQLAARLLAKTTEVRELLGQLIDITNALKEQGITIQYTKDDDEQ